MEDSGSHKTQGGTNRGAKGDWERGRIITLFPSPSPPFFQSSQFWYMRFREKAKHVRIIADLSEHKMCGGGMYARISQEYRTRPAQNIFTAKKEGKLHKGDGERK